MMARSLPVFTTEWNHTSQLFWVATLVQSMTITSCDLSPTTEMHSAVCQTWKKLVFGMVFTWRMSQVHFFLEVKDLIDRNVTPSPPPEINHRNTINTKKMMDVANSTQRHHNFLWGRSTGSKFGQHSIVPLVEFKGYLTLFWVTLTIHNLVWSLCYLNTVPSLQPQLILLAIFNNILTAAESRIKRVRRVFLETM